MLLPGRRVAGFETVDEDLTGAQIVVFEDVWSSPDGVDWSEVTSEAVWGERQSHTSVVFDARMWVIGGRSTVGLLNDVWASPDGRTWTGATSSAPWSGRQGHTSVSFDGRLWVIGGVLFGGGDVWSSAGGTSWSQAVADAGGEFDSGFEVEDFADWDDHVCPACNAVIASTHGTDSPSSTK